MRTFLIAAKNSIEVHFLFIFPECEGRNHKTFQLQSKVPVVSDQEEKNEETIQFAIKDNQILLENVITGT